MRTGGLSRRKKLLLEPLLLDAPALEHNERVQSNAKRRDTFRHRGPNIGIHCVNRYGIWDLLRGAYSKPINAPALHDIALVGIIPAPGLIVSYRLKECLIFSKVA